MIQPKHGKLIKAAGHAQVKGKDEETKVDLTLAYRKRRKTIKKNSLHELMNPQQNKFMSIKKKEKEIDEIKEEHSDDSDVQSLLDSPDSPLKSRKEI